MPLAIGRLLVLHAYGPWKDAASLSGEVGCLDEVCAGSMAAGSVFEPGRGRPSAHFYRPIAGRY